MKEFFVFICTMHKPVGKIPTICDDSNKPIITTSIVNHRYPRKYIAKNIPSNQRKPDETSPSSNAESSTSAVPTNDNELLYSIYDKVHEEKGWQLSIHRPIPSLTLRNRIEKLKFANDVSFICQGVNRNSSRRQFSEQNSALRRLNRKLQCNISAHSTVGVCSCTNIQESCAGVVRGAPISFENIKCPFTSRVVPPVLFQTYAMEPPWIKLQSELLNKVKEKQTDSCGYHSIKILKRPLTFAHATQKHLPAIRCLLESYFWANIELSMVAQYPEFSCVVLYGKLIVGFGYLSPGLYNLEGYINFLFVRPHWRRCGIAEIILYFLRQQSLYWTLTLHVSPTSEALSLYNKFGFKTSQRIHNFYDGYIISNTQADKDALFMKLESKISKVF